MLNSHAKYYIISDSQKEYRFKIQVFYKINWTHHIMSVFLYFSGLNQIKCINVLAKILITFWVLMSYVLMKLIDLFKKLFDCSVSTIFEL